jgi:hypothetical protein
MEKIYRKIYDKQDFDFDIRYFSLYKLHIMFANGIIEKEKVFKIIDMLNDKEKLFGLDDKDEINNINILDKVIEKGKQYEKNILTSINDKNDINIWELNIYQLSIIIDIDINEVIKYLKEEIVIRSQSIYSYDKDGKKKLDGKIIYEKIQ